MATPQLSHNRRVEEQEGGGIRRDTDAAIRVGLPGYHHQSGAKKLNPELLRKIDIGELVDLLMHEEWKGLCEIIPDYMPPFPSATTRPKVVVRIAIKGQCEHQEDCHSYLRHSAGPRQGFFWDCYGDDLMSVELAILALHQAPYPVHTGPLVFKLSLPKAFQGAKS